MPLAACNHHCAQPRASCGFVRCGASPAETEKGVDDRFPARDAADRATGLATREWPALRLADECFATKAVVGSGSILTIASATTR